jgi:7-keto-8-aminopelargonate synthetase-like enzyme
MGVFAKSRAYTAARNAIAGRYYLYFVAFENPDGARAARDGREIVVAGSNSYLGLTEDGRVLATSHDALAESGSSCPGSRLLNGNLRLHEYSERSSQTSLAACGLGLLDRVLGQPRTDQRPHRVPRRDPLDRERTHR